MGSTDELEDYFTIPVKLAFKDKSVRDAADYRMRTLCEVGGIIPYHRTLRTAINSTIGTWKARFPKSFIQVKVDSERLQLRISRKEAGVWYNNIDTVDLPESVLDLSRVGPTVSSHRNGDAMDVSAQLQG